MLGAYLLGIGIAASVGYFQLITLIDAGITAPFRSYRGLVIDEYIEKLESEYSEKFGKVPTNQPLEARYILEAKRDRFGRRWPPKLSNREYKAKEIEAQAEVYVYMERLLKETDRNKEQIKSFFVDFDNKLGYDLFSPLLENRLT